MADLVRLSPGRLARPLRSEGEELAEFLAFTLAGDLYGIELTRVREIVSSPPLTVVPRAPRDVLRIRDGNCAPRGESHYPAGPAQHRCRLRVRSWRL
jgi:hypothetical protein